MWLNIVNFQGKKYTVNSNGFKVIFPCAKADLSGYPDYMLNKNIYRLIVDGYKITIFEEEYNRITNLLVNENSNRKIEEIV